MLAPSCAVQAVNMLPKTVLCSQAGSQAPIQHIHAELAEIKVRNEAQQARVEDILSQRLALEQQAKQVRRGCMFGCVRITATSSMLGAKGCT